MRKGRSALKLLGLLGLASGLHVGCRNLGGAVETSGDDAGAGADAASADGASSAGAAATSADGASSAGAAAASARAASSAGGGDASAGANADGAGTAAGAGAAAGTRSETTNAGHGGAAPSNDAGAAGWYDGGSGPGGARNSDAGASAGGTLGNPTGSNTFGAAGINESGVDNLVPGCVSFGTSQGPVTCSIPHGLAVNKTSNGIPYVLYATQPTDNTVTLRWKLDFTTSAGWTPWSCFDFVPYPAQITAINVGKSLQSSQPEVYASTSLGKLYVRRMVGGAWAPWQELSLPNTDSHIIDVAATHTPDTNPFLYVIDNGKLFARHHLADDSFSGYSPWIEIPGAPLDASRVCAGVRPIDRRQQVFVLTTSGVVRDTTQQSTDANSGFGAFESSGATPLLSDIDCGYSTTGDITVFALSSGGVWSRDSATSVWLQDAAVLGEALRQFAVGSTAGVAPTVFGVGVSGTLYSHTPGGSWVSIP